MSRPKVGFLITARLKSSRLPKKVILDIAGKPAIVHQLDRIKQAKHIDKIVICTSTNPQDDPLVEIARQEGVECYRGSEEDVLSRLLKSAQEHDLDYFVNITADCPLIDPKFIDQIAKTLHSTDADLVRMTRLPLGQGPNGVRVGALQKICLIKTETETEVWGKYFSESGEFRLYDLDVPEQYCHAALKTSLDYPEDYEFLKRIFAELGASGNLFSLTAVIDLVNRKPELLEINGHCAALGKKHIARTSTPVKFRQKERV